MWCLWDREEAGGLPRIWPPLAGAEDYEVRDTQSGAGERSEHSR